MLSRHAKITRHIVQRIDMDTLPPVVVRICLFMVTLLGDGSPQSWPIIIGALIRDNRQ